jgi:hypothetical protein
MVVGVEIVKRIFILLLLTGCSSFSNSSPITIFGARLLLNNSCELEFSGPHDKGSYSLPFKAIGKCRLVTHQHTNIPKTLYVNGMYLMFIENNLEKGGKCKSEHTAIGINNDGAIFVTSKVKRSSSCFQAKENIAFEYFSKLMKKY